MGRCEDVTVLWLPKKSTFPCLLQLPPTNLDWPASPISPCPLCMGPIPDFTCEAPEAIPDFTCEIPEVGFKPTLSDLQVNSTNPNLWSRELHLAHGISANISRDSPPGVLQYLMQHWEPFADKGVNYCCIVCNWWRIEAASSIANKRPSGDTLQRWCYISFFLMHWRLHGKLGFVKASKGDVCCLSLGLCRLYLWYCF